MRALFLLLGSILGLGSAQPKRPAEAARTVPTFTGSFTTSGKVYSYVMAGREPQTGGTTVIPAILVPLSLHFEMSSGRGVRKVSMNAVGDLSKIVNSPIFQPYAFSTGSTQYADAVQRAQFYKVAERTNWHTLLGQPQIAEPIEIEIPAANGYLLHSRRTGKSLAVVDLDFVQKKLFEHLSEIGASPDKLVIAITKNAAYYSLGDATVCCSTGTHGAQLNQADDSAQAFVIASYLDQNVMPRYSDIQGVSQQVAEWMNDPLHGYQDNQYPGWAQPPSNARCGGRGPSSSYLLEQPTDYLAENAMPVTIRGKTLHLENMALLPWFAQTSAADTFEGAYSYPIGQALKSSAEACGTSRSANAQPSVDPLPNRAPNDHMLIGYWEGYASARTTTPLRQVSPQWDVVIVTFATPVKGSTSLLQFSPPAAFGDQQFKSDIAYLQSKGRKVLLSVGGGGQIVTLNSAADLNNFVTSLSAILDKYGFDGIDLDIETPSLLINADDKDFRNPKTPSIVNLIAAVRQLRERFGSKFMIGEVPEAAQAQAGMQVYGGQFGCFLPVIYGTRDILSFVDAQDYNTPPLEALDGNYYFPGTADYHVALSEMWLRGFPVDGDPKALFPPIAPEKVAIGLPVTSSSARNYTEIPAIQNALRTLVQGKSYAGARYKLRRPSGYPRFGGAMFWAINADRNNNYEMSNAIGRLLHGFPAPR